MFEDLVVFVADSQWSVMEENVDSFENLEANLKTYNRSVESLTVEGADAVVGAGVAGVVVSASSLAASGSGAGAVSAGTSGVCSAGASSAASGVAGAGSGWGSSADAGSGSGSGAGAEACVSGATPGGSGGGVLGGAACSDCSDSAFSTAALRT